MPEGDTIFRAARTLGRALTGHHITRFESVFAHLIQVYVDRPLAGCTVERVEARGKHLLMWFSNGLVLRTHMRMNGSWHIYRPGERWQRSRREMRILLETLAIHAVAFSVPVAELMDVSDLDRSEALHVLGPDPLSDTFDPAHAVERIQARADMEIAEALLDQSAIAGIGNIFKSEILFVGRVNPFTRVRDLPADRIERLVDTALRLMRANIGEGATGGITTYSGLRVPTSRDPSARQWVYGRAGKPCRRCGTAISVRKHGVHARASYWCGSCQPDVTSEAAGG